MFRGEVLRLREREREGDWNRRLENGLGDDGVDAVVRELGEKGKVI